ncbi:alpha/beta fold hydrolase [Nocardia sp. NPDC052566]|uniref:alpha/beta fold hydrolase n=1 Tax=Nocardia sp. NPDC052566 TaxID=3364330 RepID=UPI0037CBA861
MNEIAVPPGKDGDTAGERIVRLSDGDIHVVESGPTSATTVVLIHGLAGSTASWEPIMFALKDFHVVRVDMLGHGESAKPADGYGIAEQGRRVGAVLDRLGVRRAIVVGHSTGGSVATALATQRRELITAIALIDTGPRISAFIGNTLAGRLLYVPVVGPLAWRLRSDSTIRAAARTAVTRDVRIPDQIIADVRGMTYRAFIATSDAARAFLAERPVPDRLTDLGLPVLVIFGAQDRRWQPSSAADYRVVPHARVEILDGVGHTPMLEEPEVTAALLRGFVAECPQ